MTGTNLCIFIGRLGQDPEFKHVNEDFKVCNFSIAIDESYKKDGEKIEKTEWVRIVAHNKLAEICGEYLVKGKQVYIEGRIQTKKWEDSDGNTRYSTEIVANNMQMLGSKGESSHSEKEPVVPF